VIELLTRLATCREQLRAAAEQLRQSRADEDASRIAQETVDFLTDWLKTFQITGAALSDRRREAHGPGSRSGAVAGNR